MPVHFFCEVFCISIGIVIRCFSFGKLPVHQQHQLWLTWTHRVFNTWFTRPSFRTTLLKAYASHTCSWMFIGRLLRDLRETGRRLTQEREWVKGCSPSRMQFTLETFCTFFFTIFHCAYSYSHPFKTSLCSVLSSLSGEESIDLHPMQGWFYTGRPFVSCCVYLYITSTYVTGGCGS